MIKYNICFIKQRNHILLMNREFPPWMGCWNGIGGKLEPDESPVESMKREIIEETNINDCELTFKGIVTWTMDGDHFGGMYLYLGELSEECTYSTPINTVEGILDWKSVEWIMNPKNMGIATNIPFLLEYILNDPRCYEHHCTYREGKLLEHLSVVIDDSSEERDGLSGSKTDGNSLLVKRQQDIDDEEIKK